MNRLRPVPESCSALDLRREPVLDSRQKLNLEFALQPFPAERVAIERAKAKKRGSLWDGAAIRDVALTCLAFDEFFKLVQDTGPLRPLLREAVPMPSFTTLVGMIWSRRLDLSLNASGVEAADPQAWLGRPGPAVYSLPATLSMNGTPLLRARFMVTEPRGVLQVVAGIVGVETEGVGGGGEEVGDSGGEGGGGGVINGEFRGR